MLLQIPKCAEAVQKRTSEIKRGGREYRHQEKGGVCVWYDMMFVLDWFTHLWPPPVTVNTKAFYFVVWRGMVTGGRLCMKAVTITTPTKIVIFSLLR